MKLSRISRLIICVSVLTTSCVYAASDNTVQSALSPNQEVEVMNSETVLISSRDGAETSGAPSKIVIKRKQDEIVLLNKLIREIEDPKEGIDELIRQEKMRLLIDKVNRNLDIIESARKEHDKQIEIVESQKSVLNQQRNLPKR